MTRGMIYKFIFIALLIALSIVLILPTIGEKTMEIMLSSDTTAEQLAEIKNKFPQPTYVLEQKADTIYVKGRNITDAIMNDVRSFPGIKNAVILKHWAEDAVMARKINLG